MSCTVLYRSTEEIDTTEQTPLARNTSTALVSQVPFLSPALPAPLPPDHCRDLFAAGALQVDWRLEGAKGKSQG